MGNVKAKNNSKNNGKSQANRISLIGIISVIIIFAICIGLIVITETGVTDRAKTVMSTKNFKVNGSMFKYFFNSQYTTFLNNYGSYASYLGLDTSKALDAQLCTMTTDDKDDTWYDYFADMTTTQVKQYLIYCEGALEAGVKLEDEENNAIKETLDAIRDVAKESGYTASGYISALYGSGVKESDLRNCFELAQLAAKYSSQLNEDYEEGATDDQIKQHFNDYICDFITADYLTYSWTATLATVKEADYKTTEEYEAAKKKAQEDYEAEKAKFKGYADTLKEAKTAEEYKTALKEILTPITYDSLYKKNFDTNLKKYKEKNPDKTEEEAKKAVEEELKKDADEDVEEAIEDSFVENAAHSNANDVSKWIFGTELKNKEDEKDTEKNEDSTEKEETEDNLVKIPAAAVDTIFVDESTAKEETDSGKYTIQIVYLVRAASEDKSITKDVGHILIKPEATATGATEDEIAAASKAAKEKAQEILDTFLAGEKTKEAFEKLGEEHTDDSNVFYDSVHDGDMVDPFNNWLFCLGDDYKDVERKPGDTGLVETEYGWHVMYFVGDAGEAWFEDAKTSYVNSLMEDWFEAAEKKYDVQLNEKSMTSLTK
ncbi:MAG: peptidylprolyl isomerase [Clostridia bacterium]|nr:peptidylprolyl isomerase [Clostridia bacterium]